MTEEQWLACTNVYTLIDYLRGRSWDRKLRLFAVACCYRPYYQVADERYQRAIRLAERLADQDVDDSEWEEVHQAAYDLWQAAWRASQAAQRAGPRGTPEVERLVDVEMATSAGWVVLEEAWEAAYAVTAVEWDAKHAQEGSHQLGLLRDIFGNPFCPKPTIATAWLAWNDGTVRRLAESIYEERTLPDGHLDAARLAILADALEDAGCGDPTLLEHLRGPGPHVRGCFVIDLLTGRK